MALAAPAPAPAVPWLQPTGCYIDGSGEQSGGNSKQRQHADFDDVVLTIRLLASFISQSGEPT